MNADRVRELLAEHGKVRAQHERAWKGDFDLPREVGAFYREVGPYNLTIDGYGNSFFLPALSDLWEFQAGYRWNSLTREALPDWNDDWLVVADEAGDPFILSRTTGRILRATHGTGTWEPTEIFADLNTMAATLATLGRIIRDAGDAFTDDDCEILPKHRATALQQLSDINGSKRVAKAVLGTLGWG